MSVSGRAAIRLVEEGVIVASSVVGGLCVVVLGASVVGRRSIERVREGSMVKRDWFGGSVPHPILCGWQVRRLDA